MADPDSVPPPPPPRPVPGGRTRPSRRVRPVHPAVRARRRLEKRLGPVCGVDAGPPVRFTAQDVELLLQITRERFDGGVRDAAVLALGTVDDPRAVARLRELVTNPLEVDGIRIAAVAALPLDQLQDLADGVAADPSSRVRAYVKRRLAGLTHELPGN